MASFREGVYSLYIYQNRLVYFEPKSLWVILIDFWREFAGNFFDTNNKY